MSSSSSTNLISFVQEYLGDLNDEKRKTVSIRNLRKSTVRNFATMKYRKKSCATIDRRIVRTVGDDRVDLSDGI